MLIGICNPTVCPVHGAQGVGINLIHLPSLASTSTVTTVPDRVVYITLPAD